MNISKIADKMKRKYGFGWFEDDDCIDELCDKYGMDARFICMAGIADAISGITESDIKTALKEVHKEAKG